jgi:hypothetical protein
MRCLRLAIATWRKIYRDEFEVYVCYNTVQGSLSGLDAIGADALICQNDFVGSLPIPPADGPEWKLYPPRLSLDNFEVFVDNDLLIYKRLESLDLAMRTKSILTTTAGVYAYGSFPGSGVPVNTGLMLFPPGYDLRVAISQRLLELKVKRWEKFCDEQGLVAGIIHDKALFVPRDVVSTCHYVNPEPRYGTCGTHFVGLNRGKNHYFKSFLLRHLT